MHFPPEQTRLKYNFKAEDQSCDSFKISKSKTACVPQAVVPFDRWLHQVGFAPRAFCYFCRHKSMKKFGSLEKNMQFLPAQNGTNVPILWLKVLKVFATLPK
jgi:hypothetical protein